MKGGLELGETRGVSARLPGVHEVDLALLLLRVAAGLTMAMHGLNKRKGLADTAGWFESMGMRPGPLQAQLASITEIAAGAALALGLLVPLAGAGFVGLMLVAAIVAHRNNGFFIFNKNQGWEYTMILGVLGLFLAMVGGGRYSLDNAFGITYSEWIGTLIGLGGAVGGAALLGATWRPGKA